MNVLSLFDGISCAKVALERAEIDWGMYYASEVDKYAIQVSIKNFPEIHQLGDIRNIQSVKHIDLIIGGSPCQDLSIAKKNREGLEGSRSGLFYEYVRLVKAILPKYFILENVASMPKEAKETISKELFGIQPVMINASLVSAQNRKRLFWVGRREGDTYVQVNIPQPEDRGIFLKDILESDAITDKDKSHALIASFQRQTYEGDYLGKHKGQFVFKVGNVGSDAQAQRVYSPEGKSVTLSAHGGGQGAKTGLYQISQKSYCISSAYYKEKVKSLMQRKKSGLIVPVALTETRTEEAKEIRRQMREQGKDFCPRRMKELVPRNDGKANCVTTGLGKEGFIVESVALRNRGEGKKPEYNGTGKANALTTVQTDSMVQEDFVIRKLTPIECERLQGLPDNYTEGISNSQRYKCLGNAFNVDVVAHILKHLDNSSKGELFQ